MTMLSTTNRILHIAAKYRDVQTPTSALPISSSVLVSLIQLGISQPASICPYPHKVFGLGVIPVMQLSLFTTQMSAGRGGTALSTSGLAVYRELWRLLVTRLIFCFRAPWKQLPDEDCHAEEM